MKLLPISQVVESGLEERGDALMVAPASQMWRASVAKVAPHTYATPKEEVIPADVTVTFAVERR